ncbi:hypothetical protein SLS59_009186 [Nothophoma quercina]|uniref:Cyclic nucleotide-binding domain-containing protein n=1 Tax=Nothophoma quercina TaxID=749835 RepID=A0ABR3QNE3_9PLEO
MAQSNTFEGKRIKGDKDDSVYLVLDGKLRHIADPTVYEALFGNKDITFETVPQPMVDSFTKGSALDQLYLIDEKKKRWIKSPEAFNRYAFSWDKITPIGSIVDLVASGPDIE